MKLSIVIVSFNTKNVLEHCIHSIYSSKFSFDYEIIVVDNNSSDGSVEMIRNRFPNIKLIANDKNALFAIANNQGAEIAEGEYLLLLNSDTIVSDDNLDKLVKYYDNLSNDVICVGPKILNMDGTLQSCGKAGLKHLDTITNHFKLGSILPSFIAKKILPPGTYKFNGNIPHEVSWVSGACMLCRTNLYKKVGGLNEHLEFYGEEPEFGFRTKKLGYRTIYYPHCSIIHLGGQSTKISNEKESDLHLQKSLRRYGLIINETVGYKYAIKTSQITKVAYKTKAFLLKIIKPGSNIQPIKDLIDYENKVIDFLKRKIQESEL